MSANEALLQHFALCGMTNQVLLQDFALVSTVQLQINCIPCSQSDQSNFAQHVITSEILKGSSIITYYIIGGACVIICFEA